MGGVSSGLQVPVDPSEQPIVAKNTLKRMTDQLPGKEKLDADVEDLLANIAEEFVKEELKDVQLYLGNNHAFDMYSFSTEIL
jgi:hypothetical protein